jgi:hypothetical protein
MKPWLELDHRAMLTNTSTVTARVVLVLLLMIGRDHQDLVVHSLSA